MPDAVGARLFAGMTGSAGFYLWRIRHDWRETMKKKIIIHRGSWEITTYNNALTDVECKLENATPKKLREFVDTLTQAITAAELMQVQADAVTK